MAKERVGEGERTGDGDQAGSLGRQIDSLRAWRHWRCRWERWRGVDQVNGNTGSGTDPRFEITFGGQLIEHLDDSAACDFQRSRKATRRRKAFSRPQLTAGDCVPQGLRKLATGISRSIDRVQRWYLDDAAPFGHRKMVY